MVTHLIESIKCVENIRIQSPALSDGIATIENLDKISLTRNPISKPASRSNAQCAIVL
jgi:hypothetical protein